MIAQNTAPIYTNSPRLAARLQMSPYGYPSFGAVPLQQLKISAPSSIHLYLLPFPSPLTHSFRGVLQTYFLLCWCLLCYEGCILPGSTSAHLFLMLSGPSLYSLSGVKMLPCWFLVLSSFPFFVLCTDLQNGPVFQLTVPICRVPRIDLCLLCCRHPVSRTVGKLNGSFLPARSHFSSL